MKKITLLIFLIFTVFINISAQRDYDRDGSFNPDSLTEVTLTGSAIIDTSTLHSKYYLDEDSDGVADYRLNFGPYWYSPDSSEAVRPNDGDVITIFGGLNDFVDSIDVVVVYEINGEFWRDPYEPFWTNFTRHPRLGHRLANGLRGFAFGWMNDSLTTVELTGIALVDTTCIMNRFYLDEDGDGYPDYFLNFGPYWYEPESGTIRPSDGDPVSIKGGLIDRDSIDAVVVYELNGEAWRDSSSFGRHPGGRWFRHNMNGPARINNPFDDGDNFTVNQNWRRMGGMNNDSLFGQMLELYPQNIPNSQNQNAFCGFEIGLYDENGTNKMWKNGRTGGRMQFNSSVQYQFHYSETQTNMYNVDESSIAVKYWDEDSEDWQTVNDVVVDTENNTVSFESTTASSLIIMTSESITDVTEEGTLSLPENFSLKQNYPNPFNPETKIAFSLPSSSIVRLNVYNVLGEKVTVLLNEQLNAGYHEVNFNASNLASGVYLYELTAGSNTIVKKMNLMK